MDSDPDPGGPKPYGYNWSGSAILIFKGVFIPTDIFFRGRRRQQWTMPWGIRTAATRSRSDRRSSMQLFFMIRKVPLLENFVPASRFVIIRRNLSKALLLRVAIFS
jgi:hypothetical protein